MFVANLSFYKKLSRNRSIAIANYINPLIDKADANILDFGAGNMYLAEHLATNNKSFKVHGIDVITDQNLNNDRLQQFPNLSFEEYAGGSLPYSDGTYDIVIASAVMHHTPDPEYYLSELKRVVKKGGSILLIEEMYHNIPDKWYIMAEDLLLNKLKKGVPVPLKFRSYKHYLNEFKKQGLEIGFEGYVRPSFPWKHHYVFKLNVL